MDYIKLLDDFLNNDQPLGGDLTYSATYYTKTEAGIKVYYEYKYEWSPTVHEGCQFIEMFDLITFIYFSEKS